MRYLIFALLIGILASCNQNEVDTDKLELIDIQIYSEWKGYDLPVPDGFVSSEDGIEHQFSNGVIRIELKTSNSFLKIISDWMVDTTIYYNSISEIEKSFPVKPGLADCFPLAIDKSFSYHFDYVTNSPFDKTESDIVSHFRVISQSRIDSAVIFETERRSTGTVKYYSKINGVLTLEKTDSLSNTLFTDSFTVYDSGNLSYSTSDTPTAFNLPKTTTSGEIWNGIYLDKLPLQRYYPKIFFTKSNPLFIGDGSGYIFQEMQVHLIPEQFFSRLHRTYAANNSHIMTISLLD